ncbi:hydrolase [Sporosarcina sp. Te-1]|uniref:hydrolase n=1 Tax=Sporosarcina sp. Te-1 TaxID=2818390 RepID=UPI001A9DE280|nr:hydrolase [Sporosarcina sp. Te-1]QTD41840.1 hydrolase [Sporosarcina sp. Te-1]
MGSRVMHLLIANRFAEHLMIEDKTPVLLGGIAADAVFPKEASHFFIGETENYTRGVDFNSFLKKYSSYSESPYILGYYTHLIADDVWFKGFYLSWLKNRMNADESLYERYHNDFRLLNGLLLEHYGNRDELLELLQNTTSVQDLEEVKRTDLMKFIPYVLSDLTYDQENIHQDKLHVFTLDQIIGYIETSVEIALLRWKRRVF